MTRIKKLCALVLAVMDRQMSQNSLKRSKSETLNQ